MRFEAGVTVLSHSNGTIVHGWLLKAIPKLVRRSCLVDPVCFALWEPSIPYNFLYAPPKSPFQSLSRFFVARELGIANTLHRHFDWISSLLYPHQIPHAKASPSKATIFLSENDSIVDVNRIGAYLRREGVEGVNVFPRAKHGEGMMGRGKGFRQVLDWVRGV